MLAKWKEWLGTKSRAERRVAPRRRGPRLELEQLETRMVPAAIRFLPGFTTTSLPAEDDSPSQTAVIPFTVNFFGVQTNQVHVNNNGNITFSQDLSQFTPIGPQFRQRRHSHHRAVLCRRRYARRDRRYLWQ